MTESIVYNADCLEAMREMPDNAFDLAVVDPPYGDGLHAEDGGGKGWFTKYNQKAAAEDNYNRFCNPGSRFEKYKPVKRIGGDGGGWKNSVYGQKIIEWDVAPGPEYFEQLFRVSKNQIIWGGNYFNLPPTRCFLVWRKLSISENFSMAMAEYAWTSFSQNAKLFDFTPQGKQNDPRFHPTQKPIELYAWIFQLFAKPGQKILDTHLGSGSSRIAAYDAGLDFVWYEIDKTYFDKQEARFKNHAQQINLFSMQTEPEAVQQSFIF